MMECKCDEIKLMEEKIKQVKKTLLNNIRFQANILSSKREQNTLKKDSWKATESTVLKSDIEGKLPNMTDIIEKAHKEFVKEATCALRTMGIILEQLKKEDSEFHAAE